MSSPFRSTARDERPSIGELVSTLSEKMSALIRGEIALAKAEMAAKAKSAGIGIGLLAGAAVLAMYAVGVLIASAVLGLSNVLSPWLAALLVGVALLLVVALLGALGAKALGRSSPPAPTRAQENVKLDVEAVKEGLQS